MRYARRAISSLDGRRRPPVYLPIIRSPVRIVAKWEFVMAASWSCSVPMFACRSLDGRQNWCAFVLHQDHHVLGRRRAARVSADEMHVVRSLIEGLARR